MTQQQLAHVLIKILGLSLLLSGVPMIVMTIFGMILTPNVYGGMMSGILASLVTPVVGIVVMALSGRLANFLFANS